MSKTQTIPLEFNDVDFNDKFFNVENLNLLKSCISKAQHVDKGAYEFLSLNLNNEIDYFLGSGDNENELSRKFFIKKLIDACEQYGYLKGKSKKFLKTVNSLKQKFINIKDGKPNEPDKKDKDVDKNEDENL